MMFQEELAIRIFRGEKTVTRRPARENPNSPWWKGGCSYRPGRDYAVCPGRGRRGIGRIKVLSVRLLPLGDLSPAEASREGFASPGGVPGGVDTDVRGLRSRYRGSASCLPSRRGGS